MSSDGSEFFHSVLYYSQYKLTVYDNLFVSIVYGVYIVLYVASLHVLLSTPGFTSSRPRMFMFGITTFMFALAIIALVLQTAFGFQQMKLLLDFTDTNVWPFSRISAVFIVVETFRRLMYILSDIVCAWRAVVLWNRDKRVIAILLLFILGTTGTYKGPLLVVVVCSSGPTLVAAAGCELGLSVIPIFRPPYNSVPITANYGPLIMVGPTLATNLISTGLIAWKAWQHRVSVRKHLGEGTGSVRVDRVFALLIESGFIYCCLWIVYLISAFNVMPNPGFTVMNNVLLFVSGLYPTLIIILVAMQRSPVKYYATYSTGMQFARGPALAPPRAGDMSPYVYTICRENANDSDKQVPSEVLMKTR
ncbi:hypothetical protein EDB89DRAFT_2228935 [Lactarius sanguifluus]|nr:hypothetical protein EDB89DRAFT_2228935 [Lactarius sanguifluus]